jgi:hypothetical protein
MHEHYWFCQAHAAEYNKSWNFFSGMTDDQVAAAQAARQTGERPTWSFKASNRSREAAAAAKNPQGWGDSFSLFGFSRSDFVSPQRPDGRSLGKMERGALADLDLPAQQPAPARRAHGLLGVEARASAPAVRADAHLVADAPDIFDGVDAEGAAQAGIIQNGLQGVIAPRRDAEDADILMSSGLQQPDGGVDLTLALCLVEVRALHARRFGAVADAGEVETKAGVTGSGEVAAEQPYIWPVSRMAAS